VKTNIIIFQSITYALKAKRLLKRNGIDANVIKTDFVNQEEGCTHAIEFKASQQFNVINILRENKFDFKIKG